MSEHDDEDDDGETPVTGALRIDKWLWYVRFFKSRSLASDAVAGGLVHLNGERVKASRPVHAGDTLHITRGQTKFEVTVQSIPSRRGPASEAQAHYVESARSQAERERQRQAARSLPQAPLGRPDKHGRRMLRRLRRS
jgi:ribosome-associated heat shock protein Hsp15